MIEIIGTFAGGIGLFLLGMRLMTDGLKVAAGSALRRVLKNGTRTRVHALATGAGLTGLVQSSSAVTVATIGFVNAGLLTLGGAMWVVFGSNVGTTTTGWLVAATGFKINVEAFALPLVGVGILWWTVAGSLRRGAVGQVIGGFGLFFLGLGFMQDAFAGLSAHVDLATLAIPGIGGILVFLGIGTLLTILTQSSSAAIAIVLSAASQGVIGLNLAGAAVVGANVGTTATALLAVIGATPDARRTAVAHVAFNVLAAGVAVILLPFMLEGLHDLLYDMLDEEPSLPMLLAAFHTAFNVGGVLLMWPMSSRLERWLKKRFVTTEEEEGRPRHLDANILTVPVVALDALRLETRRLGHVAAMMLLDAYGTSKPSVEALERRKLGFDRLMLAISSTITKLDRSAIPMDVGEGIQTLVHASQHYLMAVEQAIDIAKHRSGGGPAASGGDSSGSDVFSRGSAAELLEMARTVTKLADPGSAQMDVAAAERALGALDERSKAVQLANLADVAKGKQMAASVAWHQALMSEIRRGARRVVRAGEILKQPNGAVREQDLATQQAASDSEAAKKADGGVAAIPSDTPQS